MKPFKSSLRKGLGMRLITEQTDRDQIHSRINNYDCRTFQSRPFVNCIQNLRNCSIRHVI